MMKKCNPQKRSCLFAVITLIVGSLMTFGCGGGSGGSSDDGGGSTGSPEIALSSSSIEFGNLVVGQTADRSVTIQNTGTANLNIGAIAALAAPFSIESNCSNQAIAPNGSCTVVVRFSPTTQGPAPGSLVIPSDDLDESSLTVALNGVGQGLNVAISNVAIDCPAATTATVTVTVADSNNNPVTGLLDTAFSLSQNGGNPLILSNFANTTAVPVSVALALDFSNSLILSIGLDPIRDTAIDFIDTLKATDRGNVFKFAEKVDSTDAASSFVDADLAGKALLKTAVNRANDLAGSPTYVFDTLDFILEKIAAETYDRKAVIVVTDGFDNDSIATIDDVIANANDDGVFIFSIGLGTQVDTVVLQRLANETGGQYFRAPTGADLTDIYAKISNILSNQYQFEFDAPVQGGSLNVVVTRGADTGEDTVVIPTCP